MRIEATIEVPGELATVSSEVYVAAHDGLVAVRDGKDGKPESLYVGAVKVGTLVTYPEEEGDAVYQEGGSEPVAFVTQRTRLHCLLEVPVKGTSLLIAAEELLELKDGKRDEGYAARKPVAWERLRKAVKESRG